MRIVSIRISEIKFSRLLFMVVLLTVSCKNVSKEKEQSPIASQINSALEITEAKENGSFKAYKSKSPLQIDGLSKDKIWSNVNWYDMNYLWMGKKVDSTDYHGRFKLSWDSKYLYVLVEVVDDKLNPTLVNGIENYWKGDYVEVFIDEDRSGGKHRFNHQAFAYHVSTEGHVIDKNMLEETVFFDDHIEVVRSQEGDKYLWEMAIKLFDKQFNENRINNIPVKIIAQKSIGFSIAYGDNDGNNNRENFIGSKKTHGNNNDEGYINSNVFGSILFID